MVMVMDRSRLKVRSDSGCRSYCDYRSHRVAARFGVITYHRTHYVEHTYHIVQSETGS